MNIQAGLHAIKYCFMKIAMALTTETPILQLKNFPRNIFIVSCRAPLRLQTWLNCTHAS